MKVYGKIQVALIFIFAFSLTMPPVSLASQEVGASSTSAAAPTVSATADVKTLQSKPIYNTSQAFLGATITLTATETPSLLGDVDGNGSVDGLDAAVLLAHFNQHDGDATYQEGDFNGDGDVNLADVTLFAAAWGKQATDYDNETLEEMSMNTSNLVVNKLTDADGQSSVWATVTDIDSGDVLKKYEIEDDFRKSKPFGSNSNVLVAKLKKSLRDIEFREDTGSITTKHVADSDVYADGVHVRKHEVLMNVNGKKQYRTISERRSDKRSKAYIHLTQLSYDDNGNQTKKRVAYSDRTKEPLEFVIYEVTQDVGTTLSIHQGVNNPVVAFQGAVTNLENDSESTSGLLQSVTATSADGSVVEVSVSPDGISYTI